MRYAPGRVHGEFGRGIVKVASEDIGRDFSGTDISELSWILESSDNVCSVKSSFSYP